MYANDKLTKELHELSGWAGTESWNIPLNQPRYSLGYLLRKLPPTRVKLRNIATGWYCQYQKDGGGKRMVESLAQGNHIINRREWVEFADTPEDAAAKLAIELFRQDILVSESRE